jgi:hypothetical protein
VLHWKDQEPNVADPNVTLLARILVIRRGTMPVTLLRTTPPKMGR